MAEGRIPGIHAGGVSMQECFRILKPGGIIRLVESVGTTIEDAPHNHELRKIMDRSFYFAGKTSSPHDIAVLPTFNCVLQQNGYEKIQITSHYINFSANAPHHKRIIANFERMIYELKPLMARYISPEEIAGGTLDERVELTIQEFTEPNWSALWNISVVEAKKPNTEEHMGSITL